MKKQAKKPAEIETILSVSGMYYAAKCNRCGWIGSSEFCVEARAGCADDCEVLCPICFSHISDDEPSLKDLAAGGIRRRRKMKKPALIVLEAIIGSRVFPKTCGECRFWAGYSCILKPTLRCKRDKVSRGCPLCTINY